MKRWTGLVAVMLVGAWMAPVVTAADLQWTDGSGTTGSLADYRGKPLVLHFWASWCPPCRTEMPELETWTGAHPEVNVLPVTLDVNIHDAIAFLKAKRIGFPALQANADDVAGLGVRGLPATVIIGAGGEVRGVQAGPLRWGDEAAVAEFFGSLNGE